MCWLMTGMNVQLNFSQVLISRGKVGLAMNWTRLPLIHLRSLCSILLTHNIAVRKELEQQIIVKEEKYAVSRQGSSTSATVSYLLIELLNSQWFSSYTTFSVTIQRHCLQYHLYNIILSILQIVHNRLSSKENHQHHVNLNVVSHMFGPRTNPICNVYCHNTGRRHYISWFKHNELRQKMQYIVFRQQIIHYKHPLIVWLCWTIYWIKWLNFFQRAIRKVYNILLKKVDFNGFFIDEV
jgi:hypothetical protein